MSGHRFAQIPHCLQFSGFLTVTFPVSRKANTSAGQKATHNPQFLHHASKISIGSVLILSGNGTFFFRRAGREVVVSAVTLFSSITPDLPRKKTNSPAIVARTLIAGRVYRTSTHLRTQRRF